MGEPAHHNKYKQAVLLSREYSEEILALAGKPHILYFLHQQESQTTYLGQSVDNLWYLHAMLRKYSEVFWRMLARGELDEPKACLYDRQAEK